MDFLMKEFRKNRDWDKAKIKMVAEQLNLHPIKIYKWHYLKKKQGIIFKVIRPNDRQKDN